MRWTQISLAASLSFSGVSYASNGVFEGSANMLSKLLMPRRAGINPVNSFQQSHPHAHARFFDSPGLESRQDAGRCGADQGGRRCPNQQCCSEYGWCGDSPDYCSELVGCQPSYGRCGDAPAPEPSTSSSTPTPTPTPTPSSSSSSIRTSSSSSSSSSSTPPGPTPTGPLIISPNGQCGNTTTCAGSGFGSCCSEFYFCGNSPDYCGAGCRSAFGNCGGGISSSSSSSSSPTPTPPPSSSSSPSPTPTSTRVTTTSSSRTTPTPTPTPTRPVSTDGRCGSAVNVGCEGSAFGDCCSEYGYCGSQSEYCRPALGCQPQWGKCD